MVGKTHHKGRKLLGRMRVTCRTACAWPRPGRGLGFWVSRPRPAGRTGSVSTCCLWLLVHDNSRQEVTEAVWPTELKTCVTRLCAETLAGSAACVSAEWARAPRGGVLSSLFEPGKLRLGVAGRLAQDPTGLKERRLRRKPVVPPPRSTSFLRGPSRPSPRPNIRAKLATGFRAGPAVSCAEPSPCSPPSVRRYEDDRPWEAGGR